MESEARSAPLQFRAEMLANVRKYRREVNSLQTGLNKARMERGGGGGSSTGGGGGDYADYGSGGLSGLPGVRDQYRQQVVAGSQILARTGESINRAQQVAVETDQVGELEMRERRKVRIINVFTPQVTRLLETSGLRGRRLRGPGHD